MTCDLMWLSINDMLGLLFASWNVRALEILNKIYLLNDGRGQGRLSASLMDLVKVSRRPVSK